ncbi:MAG: hypothetical protein Q9M25_07415 [Mariprofundaceae bacterium]|nr:hypothetical protein [Mariprofundaceae bacterium]
MCKFTLDTNCIIDLEEDRPDAIYIKEIIKAWKAKKIKLAVVAVSASENQKTGSANPNHTEFENKLSNVGLECVEHLLPMGTWNVCYWNHFIWSDEKMARIAERIKNILFPNIETSPPSDIAKNSKWRNQLCDVYVAWSHSYHKSDYLVTSDSNFHNHKSELKEIGVYEILYPKDAAEICKH